MNGVLRKQFICLSNSKNMNINLKMFMLYTHMDKGLLMNSKTDIIM